MHKQDILHNVSSPQTWHAARYVYCNLTGYAAGCLNVSSAKIVYVACCIFCVGRVCCILYFLHWHVCCLVYLLQRQSMLLAATYCIHCVDRVCCMPFLLLRQGMLHTVSTANPLYNYCIRGVCCMRYLLQIQSMMHAVFSAYAAWRGMPLQTRLQLLPFLSPRFPGGIGVH